MHISISVQNLSLPHREIIESRTQITHRFFAIDIGNALLLALSEIINIKGFSFYYQTAFEGIAHLQPSVFRCYYTKLELTKILYFTQPVRLSNQSKPFTSGQRLGNTQSPAQNRTTLLFFRQKSILAETIPVLVSKKLCQNIEHSFPWFYVFVHITPYSHQSSTADEDVQSCINPLSEEFEVLWSVDLSFKCSFYFQTELIVWSHFRSLFIFCSISLLLQHNEDSQYPLSLPSQDHYIAP